MLLVKMYQHWAGTCFCLLTHFYLPLFFLYITNRGSFITKSNYSVTIDTASSSYLVAQAAHPLTDGKVLNQAATVFEQVATVRALQLAGATRFSAPLQSTCLSAYYEFDVAHNPDLPFHATMQQIFDSYYTTSALQFVTIQFHGMADTTCPGIAAYATNGILTAESATLSALKTELRNVATARNWPGIVATPVDYGSLTGTASASCSLNGGLNVQGKLLNARNSSTALTSSILCVSSTSNVKTNTGMFIHVEQVQQVREDYSAWVSVLNKIFPASSPSPVSPTNSTAKPTTSTNPKVNGAAERAISLTVLLIAALFVVNLVL